MSASNSNSLRAYKETAFVICIIIIIIIDKCRLIMNVDQNMQSIIETHERGEGSLCLRP